MKRLMLALWSGVTLFAASSVLAQTAQGPAWQYQYDANGNRTQSIDSLGHATNHSYDALNRVRQQLQPAPVTGAPRPAIGIMYDGLDQMTRMTDPRNLGTFYTIDGLGNRTGTASPDTGATATTHDEAGNPRTSTDARGIVTSYSYDALNRITGMAYAGGTATVFQYDQGANAKGRLSGISDESGSTAYSYTPHGRIAARSVTFPNGSTLTVAYGYGSSGASQGRLVTLTYPSGNRLTYTYNLAGRITHIDLQPVSGAAVNLLANIGYVPFGPVRSWTWGNSNASVPNLYTRSIGLDGNITGYPLGHAQFNGIERGVAYDAAGRITGFRHSGFGMPAPVSFNQSYGYDNLDRLTGMSADNTSQSFQYDASGNRTSALIGATSVTHTIAANSNRLLAVSGLTPAKNNTWDAAGNLTGDGTNSYAYSARGRMKSATVAGGTVSYLYNGLGQRVQKSGPAALVPTGIQRYVYDEQGHLLGEYDANGKVVQETVYLDDMPVAVLKQAVSGTATDIFYIYADHIDTPRVITRATDNRMVWRWDHADPFGMLPPTENPAGLGTFTYNLRMPGQLFDRETNFFYNYYRDYDSQSGRYVQSDPIGLDGGINTYLYGDANPLSKTDPLGLATFMCTKPLHALGGDGAKSGADIWGNPLYHQYLCVSDGKGGHICGGQDQRGKKWYDPLNGPGKPSNDSYDKNTCEQEEPDNDCIEKCLLTKFNGPRPRYGIPFGTDCQEWSDDALNQCQKQCKKK